MENFCSSANKQFGFGYTYTIRMEQVAWSTFCTCSPSWSSLSRVLRLTIVLLLSLGFSDSFISSPKSCRESHLNMRSDDDSRSIKLLGIGGGIGSGKSTACKILASQIGCIAHIGKQGNFDVKLPLSLSDKRALILNPLLFHFLDADTVAHSVYEAGSQGLANVAAEFGADLISPSGELDRKKLGSIVFSDPAAMQRLEQIVWPVTKSALLAKIKTIQSTLPASENEYTYPIIVIEAAMLLDANWDEFLDGLWIVTAPRSAATERLMQTRGLSISEADARIDAQSGRRGVGNLPDEIANKKVTAVVENSGDLIALEKVLRTTLNDPSSWYSR
jgi:dephospho-CoA kinase